MQSNFPQGNSAGQSEPWYRHRWPWLLIAGPFIVVVAALFSAWIAFSHEDALVVSDYYQQSKSINQDLRREQAARQLNLRAELEYDPARGVLIGVMRGVESLGGKPIDIRLVHPTRPEKDIELSVQTDHRGNFTAPLSMLERANWQVQIQDKKGEWRLVGGWPWPQQRIIGISANALVPLD